MINVEVIAVKLRKVTLLVFIFYVISVNCLVYAQDGQTQDQQASVHEMNIEEATEYALNNSLAIKIQQADVNEKKQARIKASKAYDAMKKMGYEYSTFESGLLTVKGYYVDSADAQHNNAKRTLKSTKTEVRNQVKTDIYKYFSCLEKEKLAETNLQNNSQKLEFAKTKLSGGMISKLDYELFELSEQNAKYSLDKAQRDTKAALDAIKTTLNIDYEDTLIITGEMPDIKLSYENAEDAIKLSRTQNTYLTVTENLGIAKSRYDFAYGYYYGTEYEYEIEKYSYEKTKLTLEDSIKKLDSGIRTMYNELLTLENSIEYTKNYLEYLKKDTDAAFTKYSLGLITTNAYIDAEQNYYKAQNDYTDLLLSYRTAVLQYKAMYSSED